MLRNLFTRFGTQYREGGIIVGKFVYAASGETWSRLAADAESGHLGMRLADGGGEGLGILSFDPCRKATIISMMLDGLAVETVAELRDVYWETVTDTLARAGGPIPFAMYAANAAGSAKTLVDPGDGAIMTVMMYCAK